MSNKKFEAELFTAYDMTKGHIVITKVNVSDSGVYFSHTLYSAQAWDRDKKIEYVQELIDCEYCDDTLLDFMKEYDCPFSELAEEIVMDDAQTCYDHEWRVVDMIEENDTEYVLTYGYNMSTQTFSNMAISYTSLFVPTLLEFSELKGDEVTEEIVDKIKAYCREVDNSTYEQSFSPDNVFVKICKVLYDYEG